MRIKPFLTSSTQPLFPTWPAEDLKAVVERLGAGRAHPVSDSGYHLLQEMLHYEPSRRISAKVALSHPYFDDLDRTGLE